MTDKPAGEPPAEQQHDAPDPGPHRRSDPELITAVRGGDLDSFGPLYTRHVEAARRLARGLARDPAEADDLVADAFAKLLAALRGGGGPRVAFRAYLLTTIRNLFYDRRKVEGRVKVTDDLSGHDPGVPFVDPAVEGLERVLVARAFARLPERWQTVLWHTQVEGEPPATVALILGLTPNGVATLAYRARERLRQNYLREHVTVSPAEECRSIVDRLGAYVRSGLSARDRTAVDSHLAGCRRCSVLFLELGDVNAGLRGVLAPAVLGQAAAVAHLGSGPAGGVTAVPQLVWSATKRISRRRSTQVGAAGVVLAAAVAVALVLTSGGSPQPPPEQPAGPGAGTAPPAGPGGDQPPPDQPPPTGTVPGPVGPAGEALPPGPVPAAEALTATVTLEPVGSLVRDRPGVLAMSATLPDPAGGAGGELDTVAAQPVAAAAQPVGEPAAAGPLTAEIAVPDGVHLRARDPGDGWRCAETGAGFRCQRLTVPAGVTTTAFVPVTVAADAADGTPRVRLSGPGIQAVTATAPVGVQSDGLAASVAGIMPATVLIAGNSLLSCPSLDLTCKPARAGEDAFGRTDNDRYLMTGYADPRAPAGAPRRGMVSGATLTVPGQVVWAGLYWAGSGKPPSAPAAYLRPPGHPGYSTVEATVVRRVTGAEAGQPAYQASAEVTNLVRGAGGGTWWVAVAAGAFETGFGAFGGWALVVIAEDGGANRSVAVFDELTPLRDEQSFAAAVYGNPGQATVGLVGWEGDRGLTADRLSLGDAPLGGGDRDNLAASRAAGTPAGWNTFGTDARVTGALVANADRRPILTATTGRDAWLLGPVVVLTPAR